MPRVVSCGVVLVNLDRVFVCRATGTARWDLPKGTMDPGETPLETAVREAWEECGLRIEPGALHELGQFAYLPAKRLHLFALNVADNAFDPAACRCRTYFEHRITHRLMPEANAFAWQPLADLERWSGKGLARVLGGLDWTALRALPPVTRIDVDTAPV